MEAIPQRRVHRPGAGQAERRRQAGRRVRPAGGKVGRGRGEPLEDRLGQPPLEEPLGAVALQLVRQSFVGESPRRSFVGRVDARRPAEQHEAIDEVGMPEREVQHEARTHRVADVGRPPTDVAEEVGARPEVGTDARRSTVAGSVDHHHLVVGGEVGGHRVPRLVGLGEAVDEHDSGAVTTTGRLQLHRRIVPLRRAA